MNLVCQFVYFRRSQKGTLRFGNSWIRNSTKELTNHVDLVLPSGYLTGCELVYRVEHEVSAPTRCVTGSGDCQFNIHQALVQMPGIHFMFASRNEVSPTLDDATIDRIPDCKATLYGVRLPRNFAC